jgi:type II secretory pathway component GspD/PulD (secretin)
MGAEIVGGGQWAVGSGQWAENAQVLAMDVCAVVAALMLALGVTFPSCAHTQDKPATFVVQLKHLDAVEVARKAEALFREDHDIEVSADETTNTVLVKAPAEKSRQITEMVRGLDAPTYLCAIPLKCTDAAQIAKKLPGLLGDEDIHLYVDVKGNAILISATEEQLEQAKAILRRVDVKYKKPQCRE